MEVMFSFNILLETPIIILNFAPYFIILILNCFWQKTGNKWLSYATFISILGFLVLLGLAGAGGLITVLGWLLLIYLLFGKISKRTND